MKTIIEHRCLDIIRNFETKFGWFLENHGDGWYMYNEKGERSKSQYNFCPSCGSRLNAE